MATWIWVTIIAAVSQSLRTAQQKNLKESLGDLGASYVRFSYAIPFSWAWIAFYSFTYRQPLPAVNVEYLFWITVAGIMQIIFTVLLITLFSHRSFAAGTAFSKTEVLMAAIFEAIILGYVVSLEVGFAILLGVVAVFLLSLSKSKIGFSNLLSSLLTRQTALGLGSGAFLGFCTVAFRAATDSLEGADLTMRASMTGGVAVLMQSVIMGVWMWFKARDQLLKSFKEWRRAYLVGIFGAITTACWFYAFSANAVAPVRALGQIELLIALGISFFFFREKPTNKEIFAVILLALSIVIVLLKA
ncbi:MAG: EamA family transporter [Paracoccaceae bacterium]|jgi:drug/metabolite transporter (DMT)-like permease|nr:EamA family transporter [Paracoccaceae bacterium]